MMINMFSISENDSISVVTKIFIFIFSDKNRSGLKILRSLNILMKEMFNFDVYPIILEITTNKSN